MPGLRGVDAGAKREVPLSVEVRRQAIAAPLEPLWVGMAVTWIRSCILSRDAMPMHTKCKRSMISPAALTYVGEELSCPILGRTQLWEPGAVVTLQTVRTHQAVQRSWNDTLPSLKRSLSLN